MRVYSIFRGLQGEARHAGQPCVFVRMAGCNRTCSWCDTKYANTIEVYKSHDFNAQDIVKQIRGFKKNMVVWTGGEPMIQLKMIKKCMIELPNGLKHHLETNGDMLPMPNVFDYIAFSPKDISAAVQVSQYCRDLEEKEYDIKVVTDAKNMNKHLIPYATMLMPLSTPDPLESAKIQQRVWNYCIYHNKRFCMRQHIAVWGNEAEGK